MARGLTDAFAQGFVDMFRAKKEGMDSAAARAMAIIGPTSLGLVTRAKETVPSSIYRIHPHQISDDFVESGVNAELLDIGKDGLP